VTSPAVTYSSYLRVPELLDIQSPRSEEHDELLFIIIHQVYELWFKQLLHELGRLQEVLAAGDTAATVQTLRRILAILKTIVAQIDVLETLTPLGFMSFRGRLAAASGFQSAQFRQIEAVLGRRDPKMLTPYAEDSPEHARITAAMAAPDLFDSLLAYLEARGHAEADPEARLIEVHRSDPEATMVCEQLVDLDEGVQEWRYRHVKMVERTIGTRSGTGGSSGADYLRSTLFRPVFPALWAIRSQL
jgi:tryptophan 2,3-dioxygenase